MVVSVVVGSGVVFGVAVFVVVVGLPVFGACVPFFRIFPPRIQIFIESIRFLI